MSASEKESLIRFLLDAHPDYIDTATFYGKLSVRVNPILGRCLASTSHALPIVNKIGGELGEDAGSGLRAIREFEQGLDEIRLDQIDVTLVHRASKSAIDRDSALHDAVRRSGRSRLFGICTNDPDVLELYCERMEVDVLQAAVNLLDYQAALPVLRKAHEKKILVQARSVLASGLMNGTYTKRDVDQFTDEMRCRYRANPRNRQVYAERMEKVERIKAFFEQVSRGGDVMGSFATFCYAVTKQSPYVDSVILGGSTLSQLKENLTLKSVTLPPWIVEQVFSEQVETWAAPYCGFQRSSE